MESRGGHTGGLTLHEVLRGFEAEGFRSQFVPHPDGQLECVHCHAFMEASSAPVRSMRRVEGVSDPADMVAVAAIVCPRCGARGTGTFHYGPGASEEDARVLRALDQRDRPRQRMMEAVGADADPSLVRDSGWLRGPDG